MLNHSVLETWGETLQVTVGAVTREVTGVYIDAYEKSPVGNTEVERPDPSFSFRVADYNRLAAKEGDTIARSDGVSYTVTSEPTIEYGDWCNVMVR